MRILKALAALLLWLPSAALAQGQLPAGNFRSLDLSGPLTGTTGALSGAFSAASGAFSGTLSAAGTVSGAGFTALLSPYALSSSVALKLPLAGGTLTGPLTGTSGAFAGFSIAGASPATSGASIFSIQNSTAPASTNLLAYQIDDFASYDIPTFGGTVRPRIFETDLNVPTGVTSTTIHENLWSMNVLTGGGTSAVEINQFHAFFQNNMTGTITGPVEGYESSSGNAGTWTGAGHADFLSLFTNGVAGTISVVNGLTGHLINSNATAASVGTYSMLNCDPMTGGGAHPTFEYCIRNANASGNIATLGHIVIGGLGAVNTMLNVTAPDAASGNTAVRVANNTPTTLFEIHDDGSAGIINNTAIGALGGSNFRLFIKAKDQSGASTALGIQDSAGNNLFQVRDDGGTGMIGNTAIGAIGGSNFRLFVQGADQSAGTTALGIQDSIGTNLFQVHDDGSIQTMALAAVSCAAASVNLTTLVVTNGLVTHC